MPPLVLVEPILRGSRLHILTYVVRALHADREIVVLTRPDYETEHFRNQLGPYTDRIEIVPTNVDLDGAWIRHLTLLEFLEYLKTIRDVAKSKGQPVDLVFMAMDEYVKSFALTSIVGRFILPVRSVYAFRYRVDYLLGVPEELRSWIIRWATLLGSRFWSAELIAFDERLDDVQDDLPISLHLVPDPWSGPFSDERRPEARARYELDDDEAHLLTLGKQDQRKGIDFLTEAMPEVLRAIPNIRWVVAGSIHPQYESEFKSIQAKLESEKLTHRDEFIPEHELPDLFAAADAVLLPYSRSFTASSGILARAAASGVPVVATDHGLVGHRVRQWNMGETFAAGDSTAFREAVHAVLQNRDHYINGCKQFASCCTVDVFIEQVRNILAA
jgi:glycosyltransferase involved in cell wall biosynthesis